MSVENISIVYEENQKRSAAYIDGNLVGECEYSEQASKWVITHTGVRPEYGGQGIARRLVKCVIEEARKRQIKIVPQCSYAQKMMTEKDEYGDVVYFNER